jgi:NADH-quinone oxidoreductase subunit J
MTPAFIIICLVTVLSGLAAMSLRNLIHCALSLAVTFAGLAALYLQLNAQFIGFAQILVYVGAVAILIVFAILLTRGIELPGDSIYSSNGTVGAIVAAAVFAVMGGMILTSKSLSTSQPSEPIATVRQLGDQLMTKYILPLEALGLLLTAALIGAVILAMQETPRKTSGGSQ